MSESRSVTGHLDVEVGNADGFLVRSVVHNIGLDQMVTSDEQERKCCGSI